MNGKYTLPDILHRIRTGMATEHDAERVENLIRTAHDRGWRDGVASCGESRAEGEDGAGDPVHRPPHYRQGDIECIEAIEVALGREGAADFCRGNVIKYAWRAASKGGADDMRKAAWYAERAAQLMEKSAARRGEALD